MKEKFLIKVIYILILLLIISGCGKENGGDNVPDISIVKVDTYENLEISDWMDADTVIVSKENDSLEKMKLEELSDLYPRSLYLYNINTKEYDLIKEEESLNLGGARLSPDKKNLLYHGSSLGDLSYYVFNLESLKASSIAGAGSANWADKDTIIGAGYTNGAYYADMEGKITFLEVLDQKSVFIVEKIKDKIYYNTADDNTIRTLNPSNEETEDLGLTNVLGLYSAGDESQMLVLQYSGSKQLLNIYNIHESNITTIAEGAVIGAVSWSPDQQMIAYVIKENEEDTVGDLYVYDMSGNKSTKIEADMGISSTCWSPSGKELAYSQWDGKKYSSSIVYLEYSLEE